MRISLSNRRDNGGVAERYLTSLGTVSFTKLIDSLTGLCNSLEILDFDWRDWTDFYDLRTLVTSLAAFVTVKVLRIP